MRRRHSEEACLSDNLAGLAPRAFGIFSEGCVQEKDCKTATAKSGRPTATTAAAFAGPGRKASGIWRTARERWIGATEPVSLAEPLSAEKQMTVLSLARPCFAYPGARHRRANQAANKTGLYENTCWNRDTY